MTVDDRCAHVAKPEGQCWKTAVAYGYCREHVGFAKEEQEALAVLDEKWKRAQKIKAQLGEEILRNHVLAISPERVPEEVCREYRNAWYRCEYLENLRFSRRPGDPIPVEVNEDTA